MPVSELHAKPALTASPTSADTRRGRSAASVDEGIYRQIHHAIVAQQLAPGTKLGEEALCGVFGINRPRIRKILQRLAHEKLVELHPNRGAYVSQPSIKEARDIFAVRRLLEPALIETVVRSISRSQLKELRAFTKLEREAELKRDRQAMIELSGEFHLRIAEMSGNTVLTQFLSQLVSRTSLIIAMYENPGASGCNCDHHERIVSFASTKNGAKAAAFMTEHLEAIEASLRLEESPTESVDLQAIFGRTMRAS